MCLGGGACFGDSGSPALTHTPHTHRPAWAETGLTSRETSQDTPCDSPTVYTDLTYGPFRAWIRDTITGTIRSHTAAATSHSARVNTDLMNTLKIKHFE